MTHKTMDEALAAMKAECARLKAYSPYRIVWGAVQPDTLEVITGANPTKRQANDMARKGWHVYTY